MGIDDRVATIYGGKLRTRVCGICIENDSLLLVKHAGLGPEGHLWAPPGGGIEFGTKLEENLVREFYEESGLRVKIVKFLFVYEYLKPPLHTVELFFEVSRITGVPAIGSDPEMAEDEQIIEEVRFVSFRELRNFAPQSLHECLQGISSAKDLLHKSGLFKFEKN